MNCKAKCKGQSSTEFLTLIGLAFLAAIIFASASANEAKEFRDAKESLLIKDLALKLQREAIIAATAEDGYERSFTLPDKLENTVDYFTVISNNTLAINSSKSAFSASVPGTSGRNFTKGSNKIEKIGGIIYINR